MEIIRSKGGRGGREGDRGEASKDVDTTQPPPEDAVWCFRDTRSVKSVWSAAWLYKGKIQQVMYTED